MSTPRTYFAAPKLGGFTDEEDARFERARNVIEDKIAKKSEKIGRLCDKQAALVAKLRALDPKDFKDAP